MAALGLADYYGSLEVPKDADEITIKKAYRRLVLQWHPDKHKEDREEAEKRIRAVNDAYETLSNPWKRSQYDQQIEALVRKARGYRLDTTDIKPRMSIPKEFMLQPLGYPEKFVRVVGNNTVFVHARSDDKKEFHDFFRDCRFSLWWLPEVNNMCRLRPTTTAGVGMDGGLNFNFFLHRTCNVSDIVLSPGAVAENANLIAVASPVVAKAFRFESYSFPGHYLAFKPPNHVRMMGGVVDDSIAIDFNLVDFEKMFHYITADEVFMPVASRLGGGQDYVSLDTIRENREVISYFQNVLRKTCWTDEDFETFFEGRSSEWDYDAKRARVRLCLKHVQLANSIRRSKNLVEAVSAISSADDYDVTLLPLDTLEAMLTALAQPTPAQSSVTFTINMLDSQKKVLVGLPKACDDKDVPFEKLLSIYDRVSTFGMFNGQIDAKIVKLRTRATEEVADVISDAIRQKRADDDVTKSVFVKLSKMPLTWKRCSDRLAKLADRVLDREPLEVLLPILQAAVKALPHSQAVSERLAVLCKNALRDAKPPMAAEALDTMVVGGLLLDSVPRYLERILKSAPFTSIALVVAGLGEKGVTGEEMRACCSYIGKAKEGLESLTPALLLRLSVAATKSSDVSDKALDGVAAAAAITLPGWTTEDASKLLLAVAKAKSKTNCDGVAFLYRRSCEVLSPKLPEFSSAQIIKIVLAINQMAACRPLLVAAGNDAISNRLQDLPSSQLVLLTQGLLPLGADHECVVKILDHWAKQFTETVRIESLLSESIGIDMVREKRRDLESKGQLHMDQLAKLAQTVCKGGALEHEGFWTAFAKRIVGQGEAESITGELSSHGRAAFDAVFSDGNGGPEFEGKDVLLQEIKKAGSSKKKDKKDNERQRSRDQSKGREAKNGRSLKKRNENGSESASDSEPKNKETRKGSAEFAGKLPEKKGNNSSSSSSSESSGSGRDAKKGTNKEQQKKEAETTEKERLRAMQEKILKRRGENKQKAEEEERLRQAAREKRTKDEEERRKRDAEEGAKRKAERERKKAMQASKKARIEEITKKRARVAASAGITDLDGVVDLDG